MKVNEFSHQIATFNAETAELAERDPTFSAGSACSALSVVIPILWSMAASS
jgi:hypothetical protein